MSVSQTGAVHAGLADPVDLTLGDSRGLGREWVIYDVGGARTQVRVVASTLRFFFRVD